MIHQSTTIFKKSKKKWVDEETLHSLNILGPIWGVTECHESTVSQDGEHDQHAEHRGDASQGGKHPLKQVRVYISDLAIAH